MSMAPGWYPDQADGQYEHYWDGGSWRERRLRPGNGEAPVPGSPYAQAESWAPSKQSALDATARPWDQAARDAPSHPWMEASSEDSSASGTLARPDYAELAHSRTANANAGAIQNLIVGLGLMGMSSFFFFLIIPSMHAMETSLVEQLPFLLIPPVMFLVGLVLVVRWAIHRYRRRRWLGQEAERRLRPGYGESSVRPESGAWSVRGVPDSAVHSWDQVARDAPSHPWTKASSRASDTFARPDYAELTRSRAKGKAGSADNLVLGLVLMVFPTPITFSIMLEAIAMGGPFSAKLPFILFPLALFLSGLVLVVRWAIHRYRRRR